MSLSMDDVLLHTLILIPIEFGLLHATFLGPALIGFFQSAFAYLGWDFLMAASTEVVNQVVTAAPSLGF